MSGYEAIRDAIISDLMSTAKGYFQFGADGFMRRDWENPQPATGNLSLAVEYMLKSFIAAKDLAKLFRELPGDLQPVVAEHELLSDVVMWKRMESELRSPQSKTIGLKECLSIAYGCLRPLRLSLHVHLEHVNTIRNSSLHGLLDRITPYNVDRVLYVCIRLAKLLNDHSPFDASKIPISRQMSEFEQGFDDRRLDHVEQQIRNAKRRLAHLKMSGPSIVVEDWDLFVAACPVCGSDCILFGSTFDDVEIDDGVATSNLAFAADTLTCRICRLALRDSDELTLAGVPVFFDRSNDPNLLLGDE